MKISMKMLTLVCIASTRAVPLKQNRNYRSEDNKGNYAFGYASNEGSSFHEESGSPGVKLGTYGVTEADGTQRLVNYIADENGFRASVEVKEQEPYQANTGHHTAPILVAQAQPVAVATIPLTAAPSAPIPVAIEVASKIAEKAIRRVDDLVSEPSKDHMKDEALEVSTSTSQAVPASSTSPTSSGPAAPVPTEQAVGGSVVQPPMAPQQLPPQVTSPRPQDLPATVFFVPIPSQHMAAYSRVHTYSVNGFVPVPMVPFQGSASASSHQLVGPGGKLPPFDTRMQMHGVRAQIPQVPPSQPVLAAWQYIPASRPQLQPYIPVYL